MATLTYSKPRSCAILVVGILLGVLIAHQAIQPIRSAVSDRYVERGDNYLRQQQFDVALDEYAKALGQKKDNSKARAHQELARKGLTDIRALRQFYVDTQEESILQAIDKATRTFTDPKLALETGVSFYNLHQYNYARYSLDQAVLLDPGYSEAWHYLGLNSQELAKQDGVFAEKAAQAFAERDRLTPKYLTP